MSDPTRVVFRMGKRLYLRPVEKGDLPKLTVWINDPEVTENLTVMHPFSLEWEEVWFKGLVERQGKDVILGIVLKDNDELIGNMGLHGIDHMNGRAMTGSLIGKREYWGKGYGTEAKMLVLDYAFNTLNLRKICSLVYASNPRSKRCLEKCGYREEGLLKEHVYRNGKYVDVFQMAVFKDSFLPLWKEYKEKFLDVKE